MLDVDLSPLAASERVSLMGLGVLPRLRTPGVWLLLLLLLALLLLLLLLLRWLRLGDRWRLSWLRRMRRLSLLLLLELIRVVEFDFISAAWKRC